MESGSTSQETRSHEILPEKVNQAKENNPDCAIQQESLMNFQFNGKEGVQNSEQRYYLKCPGETRSLIFSTKESKEVDPSAAMRSNDPWSPSLGFPFPFPGILGDKLPSQLQDSMRNRPRGTHV
jgi:hypothetical protein